jgi:stage II sporulation protein E
MPQLLLAGLHGFLLYDILKAVFMSFIGFTAFFIFNYSVPVISGAVKKAMLSGEEGISTAITGALALFGIGAWQIFGFSLRNVLCISVILLLSYKCGVGAGAATGTTIGLITCISDEISPSTVGLYALCGMLSGILGNMGKIGSPLGFIMGSMIITSYINRSAETVIYLKEVLAAAVIFLAIPAGIIDSIAGPFKKDSLLFTDRRSYYSRIRDLTVEKLEKFSYAFGQISKTFGEIAETEASDTKRDINVLFDRVADRVCSSCSLCLHCWERNFYDTYQVMFKIIENLEMKGRVEENDIPEYFVDKCARIGDFVNAVNNMYELFRVSVLWKSRLRESRSIISRQFEGMARVVDSLADEINTKVNFLGPVEDQAAAALKKNGIKVRDVTAYENKNGKYEICIIHDACGGSRSCISIIEKAVSEAVGRKMTREDEECHSCKDGTCNLKLVEMENLKITTGIARLPKYGSKVSGDSFTFLNSGKGKYTIALSDGMGTGYGASVQSRATVNMLENLMESGFDKDMAVSMINSVLVLKSDEDNPCTIDISTVDLFSGDVEFVKIGAAPTFIKKEGKVEIVRSASLPAGVLPGVDAELAKKTIDSGDMIIMVTDGIIDSLAGDEPGDRRLIKMLQELDSLNPQMVADEIVNEANRCCDEKPCDDLTVLVAKAWKKPM